MKRGEERKVEEKRNLSNKNCKNTGEKTESSGKQEELSFDAGDGRACLASLGLYSGYSARFCRGRGGRFLHHDSHQMRQVEKIILRQGKEHKRI